MPVISIASKQKNNYDLEIIKTNLINNLSNLFSVTLIKIDFEIKENNLSNDSYKIEIFAYDTSYKLVLFEIRKDKYSTLVNNAFIIIDYIKENKAKFKILLKEYLDEKTLSYLNLNPRLIVIGEDFSKGDEYAIKQMPYEVDLIKTSLFSNLFVIEKLYQSHFDFISNVKLIKNIYFKKLHQNILELDDCICASGNEFFCIYRAIKIFCFIVIKDDELSVKLLLKKESIIDIKKLSDVSKVIKLISENYDK